MNYYIYNTEIGPLSIFSDGVSLKKIDFSKAKINHLEFREDEIIFQTITQIREYLNGSRKEFKINYSLDTSAFQKEILDLTVLIPYGEKLTYGELAQKAGRKCARAVGSVMRKNPIPIIIPCHRVIGKSNPYAYSGGTGEHIKKFLINLEEIKF